jgi:hypothetical protein
LYRAARSVRYEEMTSGMTPSDTGITAAPPRLYPNRGAAVPATPVVPGAQDLPGEPDVPEDVSVEGPADGSAESSAETVVEVAPDAVAPDTLAPDAVVLDAVVADTLTSRTGVPGVEGEPVAVAATADQAGPVVLEQSQSAPGGSPDVDRSPAEAVDLRAQSRQALRMARRRRQRISIVCAVAVAVCIAVTLLVVGLARDRTPGPQVVVPVALFASSVGVNHQIVPRIETSESLGALASVGGNP